MATDALYQQFLQQAKAANPFEKTKDYAAFKTIDQLYRDERRKDGAVSVDNKYSRQRQKFLDDYNASIAKSVNKLATDYFGDQTLAFDQREADMRRQMEAEERAAVNLLQQQMQQRAEQAQRVVDTTPPVPNPAPSLAPLQQTTGVALNPEFEGTNAARSQFFVTPESTQAQFAVGAPVGGGGLGQRQRGSTERIVSKPDNFNSSRRGDF